jgi:dUTP pyrophosphatase
VIELPIQRLRDDAVLPGRAYHGDAGLDLAACERVELAPGERAVVGTGLAVAIPEGYAGFVQPRSGLADRHGITIVNSPGLIDSGYRGELKVILLNTDNAHPSRPGSPWRSRRGMRVSSSPAPASLRATGSRS